MAKHKNKGGQTNTIGLVLLGLFGLGLFITMLLQGTDVALFNPKGLIAGEQHRLMLFSAALLLAVAVPTLILFFFFAWQYRESTNKATFTPTTHKGQLF